MFLVITVNGDLQWNMGIKLDLFGQALVPVFFQGIGGIGNKFPDENIPLCIEGVDNDIQDFPGFSLEFTRNDLLCHCAILFFLVQGNLFEYGNLS
jgi:hypothetical protein